MGRMTARGQNKKGRGMRELAGRGNNGQATRGAVRKSVMRFGKKPKKGRL